MPCLQLLCLSSDYLETTQTFTRYIHVISHIASHLRLVENAKPSFLQITEGILMEIFGQLTPLWSGLTEWLALIAREMVCRS